MNHLPPLLRTVAGAGAFALCLAGQAQVQTEILPAPPAAVTPSGDDVNTPPEIARQQAAEIARGDPARWYQEDLTPEQKMRTMRKSIAAGLNENLTACKYKPQSERRACTQDARALYQREMASVRERVLAAR